MTKVVHFTEMRLTAEDREYLGPEVTSGFLVLALIAEELMQLQTLWVMAMTPHPKSDLFRLRARSRSYLLLRLLSVKVNEALKAKSAFSKALERRFPNNEFAQKIEEAWTKHLCVANNPEQQSLAHELRRKLGAHYSTTDVKVYLKNISPKAEERFLFHDTKANSFFPATEDQVFFAFLNHYFADSPSEEANQDRFNRYCNWLIDSCNEIVNTFHHVAIDVFIKILGKPVGNDVQYECEDEFSGSLESMILPIFFTRS